MIERGSKRQTRGATPARHAANDDTTLRSAGAAGLPHPGSPANDNLSVNDLPACLAITDDEVRLLHRYLGRQILALFG